MTGDTQLQRLVDRADITDLMFRYSSGIRARDGAAVAACFSADAVIDYGTKILEGTEQIEQNFAAMGPAVSVMGITNATATMQALSNIEIDIQGDTAHGHSVGISIHVGERDGRPRGIVRNLDLTDEFVRLADGWRIRRRTQNAKWAFEFDPV